MERTAFRLLVALAVAVVTAFDLVTGGHGLTLWLLFVGAVILASFLAEEWLRSRRGSA